MSDWNSEQYSKFIKERTLPAADLAAAVDCVSPKRILDIGCGVGNSTAVLKNRFPDAEITGADNSDDMLKKARNDNPSLKFIKLDVEHELNSVQTKFDVVYSNACLQWIPNHRQLLTELMSLLNKDGILAVQVPQQAKHPMHRIIREVAASKKWSQKITEIRKFNVLEESEYFDLLSNISDSFRIWEITYFHAMPSHQSIIEWYKGTGLRPYLDQLCESDKILFEEDVLRRTRGEYAVQANGEIIFRFPRLFFTARKSSEL